MKRIISILLLCTLSVGLCPAILTGCKAPTMFASGDPVVVNSEKTIAIAFDSVDAFLRWEYTNRHAVPADVTKVADTIRRDAPDAFRNARAVLRAYKTNRSPEQKALLDTWLATVSELGRVSGTYANRNR